MRRGIVRHTDRQTDTQTALTKIYFASATPHAKCNKNPAVAEMGDSLATIGMGQKLGGVSVFGGAGSPSNTMWPGPRQAKFHIDPSNRLATIHQRHRQDRQDRTDRETDNGAIA